MEYCFNFRRRWHLVNSFHDMAACICPEQLLTCTPNNITLTYFEICQFYLSLLRDLTYLFRILLFHFFLTTHKILLTYIHHHIIGWSFIILYYKNSHYIFYFKKLMKHVTLCVLWDKYKAHKRNHPSRLQITLLL